LRKEQYAAVVKRKCVLVVEIKRTKVLLTRQILHTVPFATAQACLDPTSSTAASAPYRIFLYLSYAIEILDIVRVEISKVIRKVQKNTIWRTSSGR
jgi:hypothetical protein